MNIQNEYRSDNFYDSYLMVQPTKLGLHIQLKRIQAEWRIINHSESDIYDVMEVGPGFGVFANWVKRKGLKYYGLDANYNIVNRMTLSGYTGCQTKVPPIPIAGSSFDLVYASHVLEHMPNAETAYKLVTEIKRVLRPGGLVVVVCPDFLTVGSMFWDTDYTHSFPITKRRLRQIFGDTHLEILKILSFTGPWKGIMLSRLISLLMSILPIGILPISRAAKTHLDRARFSFLGNLFAVARKT